MELWGIWGGHDVYHLSCYGRNFICGAAVPENVSVTWQRNLPTGTAHCSVCLKFYSDKVKKPTTPVLKKPRKEPATNRPMGQKPGKKPRCSASCAHSKAFTPTPKQPKDEHMKTCPNCGSKVKAERFSTHHAKCLEAKQIQETNIVLTKQEKRQQQQIVQRFLHPEPHSNAEHRSNDLWKAAWNRTHRRW